MALPKNYRPATTHEACSNCNYLRPGNYCSRWDADVKPNYVCNAWEPIKRFRVVK